MRKQRSKKQYQLDCMNHQPAYNKYVVSGVLISKLCFLCDFKSADLTVVHRLKSIIPWGDSCGDLAKNNRDPLRIKYRRRQSCVGAVWRGALSQ